MNIVLGSSWLDVPFAFPNWSISGRMENRGVKTSHSRATQLVVIYWDGIDGRKIKPLTTLDSAKSVVSYMSAHGVSVNEANAFAGAMLSLDDKQWLIPSWSYTKTIIQDTTDTGYNEAEGSKTPTVTGKLIWPIIAIALAYGFATQGLPRLLAGRKK